MNAEPCGDELESVPQAEFNDPRLVPLYDLQNRWGADDDFFLALSHEKPASRMADVGCGTGRLTLALAQAGHHVTGLDPARASLNLAQQKPDADQVIWLCGTVETLPTSAFDLILMTSHVAQYFLSDAEWAQTLGHLRRALVTGGRLAFDSRDPAARAWEGWDSGGEREIWTLPDGQQAETWATLDTVSAGMVTFTGYTHFLTTGETLRDSDTLRFRTEEELRSSLQEAQFEVEQLYGGWQRQAIGAGNGELIVVARAR
ncbi:ubiquinone biosynthesis O-methyltransferase, mitochondrial [Deinococcus xinjiangensis]|uniref:Ubiquinone biosynthesis O-methyltransferase, mitochondrial n=1 Tax=Deinococcus xinjiangensis TaxID=457454 RepID=A0ABP9VFH8_9DEIO